MNSDPKDSSAAKCIQVKLLGKTFQPEYTHQCFEEETIFGYAPFPNNDTPSLSNMPIHPSYNNHIYAEEYLKLQVDLAPSCDKCKITVHTAPILDPQQTLLSSSLDEPSSSGIQNLSLSGTKRKDVEGPSRLSMSEVLSKLKQCLPDESTTDANDDVTHHFIQVPVGIHVSEFTTKHGSFVAYLANGNDDKVESYHNQVQKLALMFIENASPVDLRSNEGGEWNILYLYLKHEEHKYSLVGYMTLYNFFSPFKKPRPGIVLRICQALILPIYQRQGHGKKLMNCVLDLAHGKYNSHRINNHMIGENSMQEIVEINVEDPCPAFVLLRNMVDYNHFMHNVESENPWIPLHYLQGFLMLTDVDATHAACKAKITKAQIHISYEIYKLKLTLSLLSNMTDGPEKENIEKQYRLMVKKRLNQFHKEDIGACGSKEEKQAYLTKLYEDAYNHYVSILNRNY
jgi:histone acetyltransferase 1